MDKNGKEIGSNEQPFSQERKLGVLFRKRAIFSALCLGVGLAWCVGCQTAPGPDSKSQREGSAQRLHAAQLRQRFKSAVGGVLEEHHFPPPTILEGTGSDTFAISARPKATHEIQMAVVRMGSSGQVSVKILGYAWVGSGWVTLGRMFQESTAKEASAMERKIHQRLATTI
jgi:hypothetical protein